VAFDAALFHELSPRVALSRAAIVGIDEAAIAASLGRWDENAVVFGRLRDLALVQDGAVRDVEAFPPRSRGRRAWNEHVAGPFRLQSSMLGHLVVRNRIVAGVLLGRRRAPGFDEAERRAFARLLPALAVSDALLQSSELRAVRGPQAVLQCVDQRLTERQREVVAQVALGHTNAEVGRALGISANTARNLLAQACARLGAANRAELVRLAVLSA
jgi:DNA-binding CsgD family transcriptional regulator